MLCWGTRTVKTGASRRPGRGNSVASGRRHRPPAPATV